MPIDQKQREKNTSNKLKAIEKRAYDDPNAGQQKPKGRQQGYLGSRVEEAARNTGMDDASGTHDYSGGSKEHQSHKNLLSVVNREATNNKKRQAVTALAKYGAGHDMKHHGEGREYGK